MSEPTKAMEGNVLLIREFVNLPGYHSIAAVFAEVSRLDYHPVFKISDCFKVVDVYLAYDPLDPETCENALHKMDVIIESAKRTRDAMAETMEYHKAHPLPVKRRRRRVSVDPRPR